MTNYQNSKTHFQRLHPTQIKYIIALLFHWVLSFHAIHTMLRNMHTKWLHYALQHHDHWCLKKERDGKRWCFFPRLHEPFIVRLFAVWRTVNDFKSSHIFAAAISNFLKCSRCHLRQERIRKISWKAEKNSGVFTDVKLQSGHFINVSMDNI